jgi:putative DNA-invertase from lambdoid prophage Rac
MKVRAYVRVSTDGQTTANQLPEVERLCAARGWMLDKVYEETGSAAKARPVFGRMMEDAKRGTFSTLVVWALDRFGRSMAGVCDDVRALDRVGVGLVSVRETWLDTAGPARELLVSVMAWVAQQERGRLIERTRAGLARAKADGIRLGRPKASVAALVLASANVAAGQSIPAAALAAGVGASTLRRHLKTLPQSKAPAR